MKRKRNKRDSSGYEYNFDGLDPKDFITVKDDFLPSPAELARSMKNAKITIHIDGVVISFFKHEADKHGVSYQQMIRQVLRHYMEQTRRRAA